MGIGGGFDREIWPQCGAFDIIYLGRARVKVHFPCAFLVSCLRLATSEKSVLVQFGSRTKVVKFIPLANNFFNKQNLLVCLSGQIPH